MPLYECVSTVFFLSSVLWDVPRQYNAPQRGTAAIVERDLQGEGAEHVRHEQEDGESCRHAHIRRLLPIKVRRKKSEGAQALLAHSLTAMYEITGAGLHADAAAASAGCVAADHNHSEHQV